MVFCCDIVSVDNVMFYCLLSKQQMLIDFLIKYFQNNETVDHRLICTMSTRRGCLATIPETHEMR
jgi:hypothetical protein